ncbi:4Fe-4S binding protein [Eubacteriaceae bacterium ES2]|nr:4Fe-4S binding protein [Eubacteriaceae bacterium ES2]
MEKRQKIRSGVTLVSLLLFPVTLNYFSPYLSVDAAMKGIISGSILLFILMFFTALFFGRAWCGWICPMAALSDISLKVNHKNVNVKKLKMIRFSIFAVWSGIIIIMFLLAGGIKSIEPLYMTENIISVDSPAKYIVYYGVLLIYVVLTFALGKRGACQSICWMNPFLVAGYHVGRLIRIPQLRIRADADKCVACGKCNQKCPMSIDVKEKLKSGGIDTSDCILCGECVDSCPKKVLDYVIRKGN